MHFINIIRCCPLYFAHQLANQTQSQWRWEFYSQDEELPPPPHVTEFNWAPIGVGILFEHVVSPENFLSLATQFPAIEPLEINSNIRTNSNVFKYSKISKFSNFSECSNRSDSLRNYRLCSSVNYTSSIVYCCWTLSWQHALFIPRLYVYLLVCLIDSL